MSKNARKNAKKQTKANENAKKKNTNRFAVANLCFVFGSIWTYTRVFGNEFPKETDVFGCFLLVPPGLAYVVDCVVFVGL